VFVLENATGEVYRVQCFSPDGTKLSEFGGIGDESGELDDPKAIVLDEFSEKIYIMDRGNLRVQVFRPVRASVKQRPVHKKRRGAVSVRYDRVKGRMEVAVSGLVGGALTLYDCRGTGVLRERILGPRASVSTEQIAAGLYTVRVTTVHNRYVQTVRFW
jgi:hypothetical protein